MDGTRSDSLSHILSELGRDREQLPFLRSACPGLDAYHREAAPGNTKSRSSCGHLQGFGCGRQSQLHRQSRIGDPGSLQKRRRVHWFRLPFWFSRVIARIEGDEGSTRGRNGGDSLQPGANDHTRRNRIHRRPTYKSRVAISWLNLAHHNMGRNAFAAQRLRLLRAHCVYVGRLPFGDRGRVPIRTSLVVQRARGQRPPTPLPSGPADEQKSERICLSATARSSRAPS